MEPNAIPGFANRRIATYVYRALLGFPETQAQFPPGRSEVTGLPVRAPFFDVQPKCGGPFSVLITGGSRGSRTLNAAARESWKFFQQSGQDVRIVLQTGAAEHAEIAEAFGKTGLDGEVVPFIRNMPEAFSQADLVVGRAGAGGVNEISAAGMASILVPLPTAADDHQRRNAEALVEAGAARMVLDSEMSGKRIFEEIEALRRDTKQLEQMRDSVRQFARPRAAERAADVMEEAAKT
jgi:UDP-N-acetylglucosamine--N-acetylmuramyl-(pentapeptide) pyrophosphoryl-undecaprenol N-acetylglucosamine transferase